MIHIEEFGVLQLLCTEDAGVVRVSVHIQLYGRGVEDVGEVEVLLPRDVGQIRLSFVYSLRQAELSQVFLENM